MRRTNFSCLVLCLCFWSGNSEIGISPPNQFGRGSTYQMPHQHHLLPSQMYGSPHQQHQHHQQPSQSYGSPHQQSHQVFGSPHREPQHIYVVQQQVPPFTPLKPLRPMYGPPSSQPQSYAPLHETFRPEEPVKLYKPVQRENELHPLLKAKERFVSTVLEQLYNRLGLNTRNVKLEQTYGRVAPKIAWRPYVEQPQPQQQQQHQQQQYQQHHQQHQQSYPAPHQMHNHQALYGAPQRQPEQIRTVYVQTPPQQEIRVHQPSQTYSGPQENHNHNVNPNHFHNYHAQTHASSQVTPINEGSQMPSTSYTTVLKSLGDLGVHTEGITKLIEHSQGHANEISKTTNNFLNTGVDSYSAQKDGGDSYSNQKDGYERGPNGQQDHGKPQLILITVHNNNYDSQPKQQVPAKPDVHHLLLQKKFQVLENILGKNKMIQIFGPPPRPVLQPNVYGIPLAPQFLPPQPIPIPVQQFQVSPQIRFADRPAQVQVINHPPQYIRDQPSKEKILLHPPQFLNDQPAQLPHNDYNVPHMPHNDYNVPHDNTNHNSPRNPEPHHVQESYHNIQEPIVHTHYEPAPVFIPPQDYNTPQKSHETHYQEPVKYRPPVPLGLMEIHGPHHNQYTSPSINELPLDHLKYSVPHHSPPKNFHTTFAFPVEKENTDPKYIPIQKFQKEYKTINFDNGFKPSMPFNGYPSGKNQVLNLGRPAITTKLVKFDSGERAEFTKVLSNDNKAATQTSYDPPASGNPYEYLDEDYQGAFEPPSSSHSSYDSHQLEITPAESHVYYANKTHEELSGLSGLQHVSAQKLHDFIHPTNDKLKTKQMQMQNKSDNLEIDDAINRKKNCTGDNELLVLFKYPKLVVPVEKLAEAKKEIDRKRSLF